MTLLNQVIAAEPTAKTESDNALRLAQVDFDRENAEAWSGHDRTYRPYADEPGPEDQRPAEHQEVRLRVDDRLAEVAQAWGRLLDVKLTVEAGNAAARADVVVDGQVLVRQAPVTFLLGLEGALDKLGQLLRRLPAVDPGETWLDDHDGTVHTPERYSQATKRLPRNHVKWQPPDPSYKQDAQVDVWQEDVRVGEWTTIRRSGAMRPERIRELVDRCAKLAAAVRDARIAANSGQVDDLRCGPAVVDFLLRGRYPGGRAQAQADA